MSAGFAAPIAAADSWQAASRGGSLIVTATKLITADGPYLAAHFPGQPVYPGVFILETVRQGVLAALAAHGHQARADVSAVHSLRFRHPLVPGDLLRVGVQVAATDATGEMRARARCKCADGTEVATMDLGFAAPRSAGGDLPASRPPAEPEPAAVMDYAEIRAALPHGPQMVLVDRAEVLDPGRRLRAIKTVSGTEPCYHDVSAGLPGDRFGYPASLIIESFGQAAVVLWRCGPGPPGDGLPMFAAARNCRFESQAYPGDLLRHEVTLERSIAGTGFASGETWAGCRRVATIGSIIAVLRDASGKVGVRSAGADTDGRLRP